MDDAYSNYIKDNTLVKQVMSSLGMEESAFAMSNLNNIGEVQSAE